MARPRTCRRVNELPQCTYFKPRGMPMSALAEVLLTVDEFEALRLADLEGLYQEDAAARMNVSRATFGRILEAAHRKVADAIVRGKALRIEGGAVEMPSASRFQCGDCRHVWDVPFGAGRPGCCPSCKSENTYRADHGRIAPPGWCRRGRGRWAKEA